MWQLCLNHINESDLVADYGSGEGALLYNVRRFSNAKLLGIEQAEFAIKQSKCIILQTNITKGNIINTPFKNECIDSIFSTMVIEHVDDKNFPGSLPHLKTWRLFFYHFCHKGEKCMVFL